MVSTELMYRTATTADIPELIDVCLEAYGKYADQLLSSDLKVMNSRIANEAMWVELLERGTGMVCVADDGVVGVAFLIPSGNAWDIFPDDWAYLRMVGVRRTYEGRGIGKTLTQKCIDMAVEHGESTLALHTSEVMENARHIYEQLGFRQIKELPPRLGMRYWLYTLELDEQG